MRKPGLWTANCAHFLEICNIIPICPYETLSNVPNMYWLYTFLLKCQLAGSWIGGTRFRQKKIYEWILLPEISLIQKSEISLIGFCVVGSGVVFGGKAHVLSRQVQNLEEFHLYVRGAYIGYISFARGALPSPPSP